MRVTLLALALAGGAGRALAAQTVPDADVKRGTLSFEAKATLGDFVGTTTTVRGRMSGGTGYAEVRGWVDAPVNTLQTGNGRRDKDLNKSMESEIYPTMRFELQAVHPEWERGDSAAVFLQGQFVIHGVARGERMRATVVREPEGFHLTASLPMDLRDYKVGGLSKMLGVLKMDPHIVVHVDLHFAPDQPLKASPGSVPAGTR